MAALWPLTTIGRSIARGWAQRASISASPRRSAMPSSLASFCAGYLLGPCPACQEFRLIPAGWAAYPDTGSRRGDPLFLNQCKRLARLGTTRIVIDTDHHIHGSPSRKRQPVSVLLGARYRLHQSVVAYFTIIQIAIATIMMFSVSEMKPSGTLLSPPTQAHLRSRLSI